MNYEKKYKEAFAHAKEIHRNEVEKRRDMEFIFPELKESEGEKVREDIISLVNEFWEKIGSINPEYSSHSRMLAWLENIPYTIDHEKREGFHLGYKAALEKQGEQKPADKDVIEALRTEYEKGRADVIADTLSWLANVWPQYCDNPNIIEGFKEAIKGE